MYDLDKIIEGCRKGQRSFQKLLYDRYAPVLLGICIRYSNSTDEAEDVLQDGFIKILKQINKFEKKGSFEGWMKRIIVNTAITNYRKNQKRYNQSEIDSYNEQYNSTSMYETDFTHEELLAIINELPEGYKIVFNLYAIEGYMHKEIAELLGIDVATSKSQYSRAKKSIRLKMEEISKINI
jgi:RNA polymerase sigma-70 factor (ECF subfamily)